LKKVTRDSEVEYKGTIYNSIIIVGRSIGEWKGKNETIKNAAQVMGFANNMHKTKHIEIAKKLTPKF
jgi:hypothetical protein